jgi:hypothetical protein
MNTPKTSQDDARGAGSRVQAAAENRPARPPDAQGADAHAMTQAARAVMHPDRHDLEWRFYHGAAAGG